MPASKDLASALTTLASHLEGVSKSSRSHGGAGWTYDEEVSLLRDAAAELERSRTLIAELQNGSRVILPQTLAHAQAMLRVSLQKIQLDRVNNSDG